MINKLLRYLHQAVFDTSPDAQSAILITSSSPVSMSISNNSMTLVTPGSGGGGGGLGWGSSWGLFFGAEHGSGGGSGPSQTVTIDLTQYTIQELIDYINSLSGGSYSATLQTAELAGLSAAVLVDMPPAEQVSFQLASFSSLIWVIMSSYARELTVAARSVADALLQMVIPTSQGYWLAFWGDIFGLVKKSSENDQQFIARFIPEVFRKRLNPHAIEKAILDETGATVRILEPWEDLFQLDYSVWSGSHRMYDGDTVGYHLIAPQSVGSVDWEAILPIIDRNKAAGVIVLPPESTYSAYATAPSYNLYSAAEIEVGAIDKIPGARVWPAIEWTDYPWNALSYLVTSSHVSTS